jgi:hypothetical protein
MQYAPVPVPPSRIDRLLAIVDRGRHPRLTHELSHATAGFRATSVLRSYANDPAGRRLEVREANILWHRGYRAPTRITHEAMWRTGGPAISIGYSRELVPGFLSDRDREIARRIGLLRR